VQSAVQDGDYDKRGTVVFRMPREQGWKGATPWIGTQGEKLAFSPATALLTDRSLVTRTFLIERAAPTNDSN